MIENPILFQTRLEQLEFDEKDEVVSGPFLDHYGHHILRGEEYYISNKGVALSADNLEHYLLYELGFELHTKK